MIKKICSFSLWSFLKTVQTNKIVSSTYIWLVIVPVFSKAFLALNSISFKIGENSYVIDLTLPFSWKMFFFSALSFVIGNVIFVFSGSEFIKNFNDYGHFKSKGTLIDELDKYYNPSMKDRVDAARTDQIEDTLKRNAKTEQLERALFWEVYNKENKLHSKSRCACLFFYLLGIVLFVCLALTNLWWVLQSFRPIN